jgi:hypothetical protein
MQMQRSADEAIERTKVREVVAIFHSEEAVEAAVEALLVAGFDRADLDRLADLHEVGKRLGPVYIAHEDLADVPQAPRQPVIMREDVTLALAVVAAVAASVGAVFAALIAVAAGSGTATALVAALLTALIAGSIAALVAVRFLRPARSKALEPIMAARGIILWVAVRSPDREDKAREILRHHGGQAIRIHEVEIEERPEQIPLSALRPDPWLGSERLGQP